MKVELPDLSVITPSFNQAQFLPFCLESIKLNRSSARIEHLVLDGGSRDGSVEILKGWSNELEFWRSEPDRGQSHAINSGVELAKSKVLCWINSDDALAPQAATYMISLLGKRTEPAWAIGQCLIVDELNNEIGRWVPTFHDELKFVLRWSRNFIMQPAVFWNRAMWDTAGPLDEQLHLAMDFDLWLRFFEVARPILIHRMIGVHRTQGGSKTSHAGVNIIDEYRRALEARLAEDRAARRIGEADVAHALTIHARRALFHDDLAGAQELLTQALSIASLESFTDPSFLKAVLKFGLKRVGWL